LFELISKGDSFKGELRFRSGYDSRDAAFKIFTDYFKVKYSLKHKNDDIVHMSPGKRGLVLLQLILHLSDARHPILIDQPEDNLDNRTIFNELSAHPKIGDKREKYKVYP
jgi:hypothetical protein